MSHLVLVQPPDSVDRPDGLYCPKCSDRFGFAFRPPVTIKPIHAVRLPASGSIVIENPTIICATCRDRGVETVL